MRPGDLTPQHIADAMDISIDRLWHLFHNTSKCFCPTRPVVVKGKKREIDAPKPYEKNLFRRLNKFLQRNFPPHKAVHGGARKRSCFTNARAHAGQTFIITRDIKDCYPSITKDLMDKALKRYGFRDDTSSILSSLFILHDRIPQGSPLSGTALNLYLYDLDHRISSIIGATDIRFGRTYDDMVLSLNSKTEIPRATRLLESQISRIGLNINQKKREKNGLQDANHSNPEIHGIPIYKNGRVGINKVQIQKALSAAEAYRLGARCVSAESFESVWKKRRVLSGWICHCLQSDASIKQHLKKLRSQSDSKVLRLLKKAHLSCKKNKWWGDKEFARLKKAWEKRSAENRIQKMPLQSQSVH